MLTRNGHRRSFRISFSARLTPYFGLRIVKRAVQRQTRRSPHEWTNCRCRASLLSCRQPMKRTCTPTLSCLTRTTDIRCGARRWRTYTVGYARRLTRGRVMWPRPGVKQNVYFSTNPACSSEFTRRGAPSSSRQCPTGCPAPSNIVACAAARAGCPPSQHSP